MRIIYKNKRKFIITFCVLCNLVMLHIIFLAENFSTMLFFFLLSFVAIFFGFIRAPRSHLAHQLYLTAFQKECRFLRSYGFFKQLRSLLELLFLFLLATNLIAERKKDYQKSIYLGMTPKYVNFTSVLNRKPP